MDCAPAGRRRRTARSSRACAGVPGGRARPGGRPPAVDPPGVTGHGVLRTDRPEEHAQLESAGSASRRDTVELSEPPSLRRGRSAAPSIGQRRGRSGRLTGRASCTTSRCSTPCAGSPTPPRRTPGAAAKRRSVVFTWPAVAQRLLRALGDSRAQRRQVAAPRAGRGGSPRRAWPRRARRRAPPDARPRADVLVCVEHAAARGDRLGLAGARGRAADVVHLAAGSKRTAVRRPRGAGRGRCPRSRGRSARRSRRSPRRPSRRTSMQAPETQSGVPGALVGGRLADELVGPGRPRPEPVQEQRLRERRALPREAAAAEGSDAAWLDDPRADEPGLGMRARAPRRARRAPRRRSARQG